MSSWMCCDLCGNDNTCEWSRYAIFPSDAVVRRALVVPLLFLIVMQGVEAVCRYHCGSDDELRVIWLVGLSGWCARQGRCEDSNFLL